MKIYAYILIVLSGVLTAQCSKVTLDEICGYPSAPGGGNGEGEGNGDYNSYWYYSYEAAQLIDAETLSMETAEDFTPYTVAIWAIPFSSQTSERQAAACCCSV